MSDNRFMLFQLSYSTPVPEDLYFGLVQDIKCFGTAALKEAANKSGPALEEKRSTVQAYVDSLNSENPELM